MKKSLIMIGFLMIFVGILFLYGCQEKDDLPAEQSSGAVSIPADIHLPSLGIMEKIKPVGVVPNDLREVIEGNAFHNGTAFDGRVLKTEILSEDQANRTHVLRVWMLDLYGKELASYTVTVDDTYHVDTLTATEDGGFLFVLGFRDRSYGQNEWASDKGYASRIIKCDGSGNLQFDVGLEDIEGNGLNYCFEEDGHFYLFGYEHLHADYDTDVYAVKLSQNGEVIKTRRVGGTDFDSLYMAEIKDGGFLLSVQSQSKDGDFEGTDPKETSVDWLITLNEDLEIIEKQKSEGGILYDKRIGRLNGEAVYQNHPLLQNYDAGRPEAVLDYGEFYLIVYENRIGHAPTPDYVSSLWFYMETVYSAYSPDGKLLFRVSVDAGVGM